MVSHEEELGKRFDRVLRLDEIAVSRAEGRGMIVPRLAMQSLRNRALTASLTVFAIAFSVMLLLGVEKVRTGARQSFADTISGTDLIVGARSGRYPAPALFRVPHRQRHQQRHLEELRGYRQAARGRLDRAACRLATATTASACSARRSTISSTTSTGTARSSRSPRASRSRPVRRRDRRRRRQGARLQGGRQDRRRARRRLGLVHRARRQAVPCLRHPRQDRHAGRPHGARQPGGDRGDPRRLAERHPHAGPERVGRRGAQDGP